jgi:guanine deaminase
MDFMLEALKEAKKGVKKKHGGPFGAIIVCNEKIIARAHNTVLKDNVAIAHAEINVIRKASKRLKKFDLSGCELFVTSEPCPMCLSAIFWARIKKIYYVCSRKEAQKIGFDDKKIYDAFLNKKELVKSSVVDCKECKKFVLSYNGKKY